MNEFVSLKFFDDKIKEILFCKQFNANSNSKQVLSYECQVTVITLQNNKKIVLFTEDKNTMTYSITNSVEHIYRKFKEQFNVDDSYTFLEMCNNWDTEAFGQSIIKFDNEGNPEWENTFLTGFTEVYDICYYDFVRHFFPNNEKLLEHVFYQKNTKNFLSYLTFLEENFDLKTKNYIFILQECLRTNLIEFFSNLLKHCKDNSIFNSKIDDKDFYQMFNYTDDFNFNIVIKNNYFIELLDHNLIDKYIECSKRVDLIKKITKINKF